MTEISPDRQGLVLVGLRGTGKSSVGAILAVRRGWPFADADVELERSCGRSVREIFESMGEPVFRDWEERTLAELTRQSGPLVLATGGGCVLRESNRTALRRFGFVVWLTADPTVLGERLCQDPRGVAARPALTPLGTLTEIAALAKSRTPFYRDVADLTLDTTSMSPAEVAAVILDVWKRPAPR